jgi:hypothetical protein
VVAALDVRDRPGGDVSNAAFEGDIPVRVGSGGFVDVESKVDVGARLRGPVAEHGVAGRGGLAPVDVAGILTVTHGTEAEELVALSASARGIESGGGADAAGGQVHGVDGRVDDQLSFGRDLAGLLEQPEREPGCDAEARVNVAAATSRNPAIGGDLGGLGAYLEEEAALVGGLGRAKVFDLDGVGWDLLLGVVDLDLHEVGPADLGTAR